MNKFKFFGKKLKLRDPKTPYKKGKFVEESNSYKSRIGSKISENSVTKSLLSIRRKVIQIENTIRSMFNLNKKTDNIKNRFLEVKKEEDRNTKIVAPKKSGLSSLIQRPKTGALDLIKNFITFTFLGWLFTVLQPLIGKLEWLFPLLQGAFNFIGVTVKFLVDALGSFIKFGYDTKDKIDNLTKNVKDSAAGVKEKFDETLTAFQNVFGGAIELVNSFINVSASEDEIASVKEQPQENTIPSIPQLPNTDINTSQTKTPSSFSTSTNIQGVNTGGIIRGYNEGGDVQNARIDPKTPITRGIEKSKKREIFRPKPNIQPQKTTPGKDVGGPEKVKEIYGERVRIVDFIPYLSSMRPDRKSGYYALLSTSEEYKKPKSDDILGIDPKTPITRGIEKSKKREIFRPKPNIQPQKTTPGKDVGGPEKVKEIYGERVRIVDFIPYLSSMRPDRKSGYYALLSTSEEYKKPKSDDILGIGNLMGASVDTALGQKPERKTYTQFADGIKYLVNYGISDPEGFEKLDIEQMIRRVVEPKFETALNKVRGEINKKVEEEGGVSPGGGGLDGGIPGGEYGGYSPTGGLERKIYEYLTKEKKMNDIQALGLMANIHRESSFIPSNKEPGGTGVGLFQWSHGRVDPFIRAVPDWKTNWKAQIDYALNEPKNLSGVTPGSYQSKNFSSSQEAADWWMREWERPRDPSAGSIKHKKYLKSIPKAPDGSAKFREGENISEIKMEGGVLPSSKLGSKAGMRLHPIRGKWLMHKGNDYPLPIGTPISVVKGGIIIRSGVFGGYGEVIEIEHFDGTRSFYAHLDKRNVKVGDKISPGTVIGTVGNTGGSTGPHLHFEFNDEKGNLITDYSKLNIIADNTFRFGGNVKPAETQKLAKKGGKEGYVNHKNQFVEQKWTAEQRARFQEQTKKNNSEKTSAFNTSTKTDTKVSQNQPQQVILDANKEREYADKLRKIKPGSGETLKISGIGSFVAGRDWIGRPVEKYYNSNGVPISKEEFLNKIGNSVQKKKYGGLVYKNANTQTLPVEKYASYNDPMSSPQLLIQPIIVQTPIPIKSTPNSTIIFSTPNVNSTDNSTQLMRS